MGQLTARQKQAVATKLNITEKAMALIKEYGFDAVKITDICKSADISVGAFYHYFESKEKIIEHAYMKVDLLVEERVAATQYKNSSHKILTIFQYAMEAIEDLGYKFMVDSFKHVIVSPPEYSILYTRYPYDSIHKAIEKGISTGEFIGTTDPKKLAHNCMRIGRGMVFDWCLYEGSYSLADETQQLVQLLLNNYRQV